MAPGHSLQTGFVREDTGEPQQANLDADGNVRVSVVGGSGSAVSIADGSDVAEGSTSDAAWVSGNGTVISLLKKIASGGGGSAVSIADGSDVAEGTTTDAAVVSDTSGTVIGFLRGLVKIFASVWDSTAGRLKAAIVGTTRTSSGTLSVNGTSLTIDATGMATVTVFVTGTTGGFDGNLYTQASNDGGVTWVNCYTVNAWDGFQRNISAIPSASTDPWIYPVAGHDTFRILLSARTVGTATLSLQASAVPWAFPHNAITIMGSGGNGATVDGGGNLNIAGSVLAYIQNVATKAASTAAVATDQALVVAVSPNNIPVLPTDAATQTTLALVKTKTDNLDVALSTRTKPADQQHTIIDSGTTVVTQPSGANLHVKVDSDSTNPVTVTGPLTDIQLRATPVPVSGTVTASGPLTDTQLRAAAVPVSGPLTDTQLRASAVPVTANAGTNLNTSALALDATLTGGTQKTQITDGVSSAAVKAASTAAAATDPALVIRAVQLPTSLANAGSLKVGGATSVLSAEAIGVMLNASAFAPYGSVGLTTSGALLAAASALTVDTTNAIGVIVHKSAAGISGSGVFEGSIDGGVTWIPVPMVSRLSNVASASTLLTHISSWSENVTGFGPTVLYGSVSGMNKFRVRITALLDASQTFFLSTIVQKITDGVTAVAVKAASTVPALTDTALVTTQRDPIPSGTNVIGHVITDSGSVSTVTPPTLTKGTQSATGFSVQDLHDAGRNTRIFMLDAITVAPVAEALATVVQWYGNAAVAGTTQPAVVPAGKTLRLTGYKIQYQSLATVGYAVVRVRANTGGAVVIGSPLVTSFEAGSGAGATTVAMTGGVTTETGSFPEGLELPAGTGIGFSVAGYGPTGTLTLEGGVRFEVHGYEY